MDGLLEARIRANGSPSTRSAIIAWVGKLAELQNELCHKQGLGELLLIRVFFGVVLNVREKRWMQSPPSGER